MKRIRSLFVAIVFLILSRPALQTSAQQPEGQISYEGEKVAFVDLVGRPGLDVSGLRGLVEQQAGEPYSGAKIQASITKLQNTGQFTKVEVKVTPQMEGLEVDLVLEPAYYIGMIEFSGLSKAFDYGRLLQVVNYPSQEPYDEKQLRDGEQRLLEFVQRNGYFLATVRNQITVDEHHKLVNVTYYATLNERARYGQIEVKGPPPAEAARIADSLRSIRARLKSAYLKPGKKWDADRLTNAVNFIRDYVSRHNFLAEQVRLEPIRYERDTNRADVTFFVKITDMAVVKTEGAKVSQRVLRRLIPIYEENSLDQDLIEEGERNLVSHFQSKGYFDVKVTTQKQEIAEDLTIVYVIDRGHKHRVKEVNIRGNQHFSDRELEPLVQVETGKLFTRGKFNNDLVRRSVQALTNYYRDAGFASVNVRPDIADHHPNVYANFYITEGPQSIVTQLAVVVNGKQITTTLSTGGMNLAPGKPFSQWLLNKDRDNIIATYLDFGYPNSRFRSEVRPDPDQQHVAVTYTIDEGVQTDISNVVLLGQQKTRPQFINTLTEVDPGKPLSRTKLLESESRLYNAGVFDWADVAPRRLITDQSVEDVLIKVHEAKRNTITYGFGIEVAPKTANIPSGTVALPGLPAIGLPDKFEVTQQQFTSPRGSLEYTRRNIRGKGETASLSVLAARLDQRASLTYADPHFRGFNWSSLLSISAERTSQNPMYTARLNEYSLQLERALDRRKTKTLLLRYGFRRTSLTDLLIPELVLPQDRNVRLSTVSSSYVRDTRDKPLDAHRGMYQVFDFGISPKAIGSNTNFLRALGQTAYYREVKPWLVWANQGRVGLAKSFSGSEVPLSERFFSGGGTSLRGFPVNAAGPQRTVPICSKSGDPSTCSNISVPVGGNMLFIVNSEARFPIPIKKDLGGVFFYDGGNVYPRISFTNFWGDYTNTFGFGLRYNTPVGPVRFDIGRNLNPVKGIKATQFFVTLGQSF
ncbi:MAG: BamA/TamA family outer membrane protein [Acidobacteria bacterium]|nr:BamA/TamA family outer membrane protein [Acidobacteriota bacterium]